MMILTSKKLKQEVKTRWNSTCHMLERYLELDQSVRRVLADEHRDNLQLSREELSIVKQAVAALKPFDKITKEMSMEKTTSISKVIPMTNGLHKMLDRMKSSPIAEELKKQLKKRFETAEENSLWSLSTFLDPRFMTYVFSGKDTAAVVKAKVHESFPKESTLTIEQQDATPLNPIDIDTESILSFVDEKVAERQKESCEPTVKPIIELSTYEKQSPIGRKNDPLLWWKLNGSTMKELQKMAKKTVDMSSNEHSKRTPIFKSLRTDKSEAQQLI